MLVRVAKRAGIFLLAVFMIVYFYIQVKNIFVDTMETEYATLTTIQDTIELRCYIVRDESVVKSDALGTYNYAVSEGEKLSKGQTIANVYSTDSELRIQEQIQDINSKIAVLEDSSVESNYFTMNVSKIDENISEILANYREEIIDGELSLAIQRKNELLIALNKRYLVVNSLTGFDDMISVLSKKKDSLTDGSEKNKEQVVSPLAGYFFSDVDGYENLLPTSFLDDVTVEGFLSVVKGEPENVDNGVVGKIVSGFEWYTICVTDKDTAIKFNSGENYTLAYPYSVGTTVSTKLISKVTQPDYDEVLLIFESDKNLSDFNFLREQIVEAVVNSYSGLKIKKEALRIVDGEEGVYILDGNTVSFKRVNKIYENDGFYIISLKDPDEGNDVSYLEMYDAVINNGKELYDGKVIG